MSPKTKPTPLPHYATELSKFYIMDLRDNTVFDIPFPPSEIGERPNNPSFGGDTIIGRTSQFVIYTSSENRTISINFIVMDDYVEQPLTKVRDLLASMAMPRYDGFQIKPPSIQIKLGAIVLRGVPTDLNFNWNGVFRDGYWNTLNVSLTVREAREIPLGSSEVRAGGWKNG